MVLPPDQPTSPFCKVEILGVPVAGVSRKQFVDLVAEWLEVHRDDVHGEYICFRDVNGLTLSPGNPSLAAAHAGAFMNAPDGAPVAWLARRRGCKDVERVSGPDMMPALCERGLQEGWRHYFLGATPETLQLLISGLSAKYPGLKVVGSVAPPFRPMSEIETEEILDGIRSSGANLLWVGLGCPKQELWMHRHAASLPGVLSLGVGAAFDLHAGLIERAPMAFQRSGMEWIWRIMQEPRRLGPRYARSVPRFSALVAREEFTTLWRQFRSR